ncbi:TonB-dependent receptor [uncultured Bacteroides sp.]|uniref:TonB-dependent receptor n=1 Tax=uncultured Bacteroides sp. TaxID=162156 RepID=UPI002AA60450|nr:TonB-dependent receptor [uncultured Bacteroides sp.]
MNHKLTSRSFLLFSRETLTGTGKIIAVILLAGLWLCCSQQVALAAALPVQRQEQYLPENIKGKVVNEKGEPLPGVSIAVKGTDTGASTGVDGTFSLQVPSTRTLLIFSYLGYQQQELQARNSLTVVMKEDVKMLGEVVVSTQKRSQSSIEVPITVSALSGGYLKKINVQQFDEMAQYVPGLQIQLQSPNNPGYVIRGVTSDDGDSRSQPRISIFQDGVSISRSRASVVELFDLERVEVVKGPQGTLFGRGAEIGAVHVIRNKPTNELSGELSLGYGSYNQKLVNGFINTPIVDQKMANRFAFAYNQRDGFIKNLSGGRLNGKNTIALRNSTRYWFGENSTADLVLDYQYDDYPGTSFKSERYAPAGGNTDPNTAADLEQGEGLYIKRHVGGATFLLDHPFNDGWKLSSITGFRAFNSDESFDADGTPAPILWVSEKAKGTQFSQELRLNYDSKGAFSGFGGVSYFYENSSQEVPMRINEQSLYPAYISPLLKAQFATQFEGLGLPSALSSSILNSLFPDQAPVVNGEAQYVTNLPQIRKTLETVLSSQIGVPVTLEQGLAAMGVSADAIASIVKQVDQLSGQPINSYHEESSTNYGTNQAAEIFIDGTYKLTSAFALTAGLRASYEHQVGGYRSDASAQPSIFGMMMNGSANLMNAISDGKITASGDYWSWVGRVALNYMFKRNNIYISASRGRRPGVILVLPGEVTKLKPEIIYSYEAGIKGIVVDGILSYDLSAYYYDWDHFQTTTLQTIEGSLAPQYLADDAGKAHTFGVEAGLRYNPVRYFSIFGNYSYINGKFNEKDENGNEQEYAGNRFRLTPKHTFSAGLDFDVPVSKTSAVYFRPSYSYKSQVYFEDSNRADLSQSGYGLANFTAGLRMHPHSWYYEIGAFGKNVFDKKYIIDAGNSGDAIGLPTFVGGSRSVVGVMAKVSF